MTFKRAVNLALFAVISAVAFGNEVKVTINDVKVEDSVYTPFYEVQTEQNHEPGAAERWIRVGVYFTTEGGWIDEIDISQLANFRTVKDKSLTLSERAHYINLNPGDHYVYVYLHPSYVERYNIDAFDVDTAAILWINGKEVARKETTNHEKKGWSESEKVEKAKGYLLNHSETPFWFINYDFKEIIKRTENSGN